MRLADLQRSTIAKLSLAYAALSALTLVILLAVILFFVTRDIKEQVHEVIEQDARQLVELYNRRGLRSLHDQIHIFMMGVEARRSFYSIENAAGEAISGNLTPVEQFEGWREVSIRHNSRRADHFLAYAVRLDGMRLIVGRRIHSVWEIQKSILHSFAWALVALIPLVVLGGIALSRRAFSRVRDMESAMEEFANGKLSARMRAGRSGDELDRLAESMNDNFDRIERLMTELKQVTSDIAHDLRTPVGRLRFKLEQALQQRADNGKAEIRHALGDIEDILSTFDAMLQIAEIDAGHARSRFKQVDVSALMTELFHIYVSVAEDSGHDLGLEADPDIHVMGDRHLLTQLFANLIENALRHTPKGTCIKLEARALNDRASISVADDGPGIPAAERERVFRRFYRLDASRNTPGNGLGLPLAEAIARLHGASIELADNHPGLMVSIAMPLRLN